ncbi:MAG: hypothetical protein HOU81_22815 [Hamadaea sp.]|uniref:hypothetical protein n=1 Tax=Hamadaea sp. TaxID=2024425 RepID=UPI0017D91D4C|nr:hypothetical protein [Hamadaea sp.]NUR73660.1 hypothetical protein [Hamadaea sp.]NUT17977.1 hypothetical protein [Hamadaea sp.]
MTRTRRWFAGGLAALLGGCSAAPAEPADPPASGTPPAIAFTAKVAVEGQTIHISYQLTNKSADEVLVLDRVPGTDAVYVVGRSGTHLVEIGRRAYAMPDTDKVSWAQAARVGVTKLPPGESVDEQVTLALPLQRRHPYGDDYGDGTIKLPDPIEQVVFCVGVVRAAEAKGLAADETLPHLSSTTSVQHLFCSDPVKL